MIRYTCPNCRAALQSPPSMAGQYDECPVCRSKSVVPAKANGAGGAGETPLPRNPRDQECVPDLRQLHQKAAALLQREMYEEARLLLRRVAERSPADTTAARLLAELPDRIKARDSRRLMASARERLNASHCSQAIVLLMQARTLAPNLEIDTLLAQARRRLRRKRIMQAAGTLLTAILIWQIALYAATARRLRDADRCLAQADFPAAAQTLAQTSDWLSFGKSDLRRRLRDAWVNRVEDLTGQGLALQALAVADEGRKACPDEPRLEYLGGQDRAAAHAQALGAQIQALIDAGGMDNAKSQQSLAATRALDRLASTPLAGELRSRMADRLAALQAKSDYETALRGCDQTPWAQFAGAQWAKVQRAVAEARAAGTDWKTSQGKYDEARALLPAVAAAAQTEIAHQAAVQAQADYETALRTYDQSRLARFAGAQWAKVQQAAAEAKAAGTDWKTAQGKYDVARTLLPAAAVAAQAELTRQESAASEAKAAYETALRTYDQTRLAQFANADWTKVLQAAAEAKAAGTDWNAATSKYDEARALLPAAAAAAQAELTRQESAASEAKAAYETALRGYNQAQLAQFAGADWAKIQQAVTAAQAAGTDLKTSQRGYDEARALLPAAAASAQTEMNRQTAAKAKADYETTLQAYDRPRLEQFGGSDWQRVLQALSAAEDAGQDWKTVALQFGQARALLATADRTAATAAAEDARRRKIAGLLASATANDSKEKGQTALAALGELLGLDPQNTQALALRTKISNYYPPDLLVAPFNAQAAADFRQRWADYLHSQTQVTNSIGLKLALIPAGTFTMGTPAAETARLDDEGPLHKVTLTRAFYLGLTEVTQAQWKAVMGAGGNPAGFKGDDLPVESVSWNDALDFCAQLTQKEGAHYRLPTEAEWEYACRAGTTGSFSTGEGAEALKTAAWHATTSGDQTHPVGRKAANAFGLFDMHGNVWEWCADWYGPYPQADQTDPTGPATGSFRILRGGSWNNLPQFCRSGYRFWDGPAYRNSHSGLRVVLDCP